MLCAFIYKKADVSVSAGVNKMFLFVYPVHMNDYVAPHIPHESPCYIVPVLTALYSSTFLLNRLKQNGVVAYCLFYNTVTNAQIYSMIHMRSGNTCASSARFNSSISTRSTHLHLPEKLLSWSVFQASLYFFY